MDHHPDPQENGDSPVYRTNTIVYTGHNAPAFLQTMQNLVNRFMQSEHQQQGESEQNEHPEEHHHEYPEQHEIIEQHEHLGQHEHPGQHGHPGQHEHPEHPEQHEHPDQHGHPDQDVHSQQSQSEGADMDMSAAFDPPVSDFPFNGFANMPSRPGASRTVRPLPRPHAHFHAHTPGGIVDLFAFSVNGPPPPTTTFTLNFGPDGFVGLETFLHGGMKDREPDPERAKVLLRGMEAVPEGLVRRLERAGGVPGGQANEDSAGCAVCWGPLLDEVEPGEWDTAKEKEEKAKMAAEGTEKTAHGDDLHGRVVALPCAHVYHAECLLPWFSRNTTCPMCRFDVDPESLTWSPRPSASNPTPHIPPEGSASVPHADDVQDPINGNAEHHQRANLANNARFNAFVSSIFQAGHLARLHPPQSQPGAQPQQQSQPQSQPRPPPEPPVLGPESPPSNPTSEPSPPFHTMPIVLFPPHAQPGVPWGNAPILPTPHAQPGVPWGNAPNLPPPPFTGWPHPHIPPIPMQMFPDEERPNIPPPQARPSQPPPPRRERKRWAPPEPVGKTLRQRVEEKERELGLRCDDMVCGVAPSDEDPTPAVLQSESGRKRIVIGAAYDVHGKACGHSFHPACLITSARVAGVAEDEKRTDGEKGEGVQDGELQVACPACRAVGLLTRGEWEEGVQASQAEMA